MNNITFIQKKTFIFSGVRVGVSTVEVFLAIPQMFPQKYFCFTNFIYFAWGSIYAWALIRWGFNSVKCFTRFLFWSHGNEFFFWGAGSLKGNLAVSNQHPADTLRSHLTGVELSLILCLPASSNILPPLRPKKIKKKYLWFASN